MSDLFCVNRLRGPPEIHEVLRLFDGKSGQEFSGKNIETYFAIEDGKHFEKKPYTGILIKCSLIIFRQAEQQLFNLLCEKADDVYGGRLPVHVRCLIDEAANI